MQRSQIVIPAQGLIEIRDTLTDLLKEFGTDDKGRCCDGRGLPDRHVGALLVKTSIVDVIETASREFFGKT